MNFGSNSLSPAFFPTFVQSVSLALHVRNSRLAAATSIKSEYEKKSKLHKFCFIAHSISKGASTQ